MARKKTTDANANNIPDSEEVSFHLKSFIAGCVAALLVGGMLLTVALTLFPDSRMVRGIAKAFAGGVCEPIERKLNIVEKALVCYQTGATIKGIDDADCRKILEQ